MLATMCQLHSVVTLCLFFALTSGSAAPGAPVPEALRWLQEYLQIDTTNPPGNEAEAAAYLAAILEQEGIASQLLTSPAGRTSLYARLASPRSNGRALALVHHIDVVPADGAWQEPPFSGRLRHDVLWGRGAIDVKSLGIAQLAVLIELRRQAIELDHDLIYLAVADEEAGGGQGTGWLLDAHPELFAGLDAVLNEGGSNRTLGDRLLWWGVEVTQKRPLWLEVKAEGRGGHGSQLNPASATHQLIRGLSRLLDRPPRYRVTDAARRFLGALDEVEQRAAPIAPRLDDVIREEGPTEALAPGLPTLFLDTVQVTALNNGRGQNVISPTATARIDIRLLPDTDSDAFLAEIQALLGDELEVEVVLAAPLAAPSSTEHPLYETLEKTLGIRAPVVPMFISGVTDARYFRQRGVAVYGFSPFALNAEDLRGIHAADEHIAIDAFQRGIETLRRVVLAYGSAVDPMSGSRAASTPTRP